MYKIIIEKQVDNPNYKDQIESFNKFGRYQQYESNAPLPFLQQVILTTELTQEEWESVKKAIITVK